MNPNANFYFEKVKTWQEEVDKLREIVLDCDLNEELKWGVPCYTRNKKNIVLIHVFKEYCALLFFKGALLKNTDGLLIQQTKNVQAARQMRFTKLSDINKNKRNIKNYIYEAIEVEEAGLKVELKPTAEFNMSEEFQTKLEENAALKKAFENLTPGRQRNYMLYFSQPKQAKTREARVEKCISKILSGKGLNDN